MNLARLTREYLYPNLCNPEMVEFEVPLLEELSFLGTNNLNEIRTYLEQSKLRVERAVENVKDEYEAAIKTFVEGVGPAKCDFAGALHGKMLALIADDMMEKDRLAYFKQRDIKRSQVFTCSFGRETAKWCNTTLKNQTFLRYENCLKSQPFQNESCALFENEAAFMAAMTHLQKLIGCYEARLEYIDQYLKLIDEAQPQNVREVENRPSFDIRLVNYLQELRPGTRVVEIYRTRRGGLATRYGLFLGVEIDTFGAHVAQLRMVGGKLVRLNIADETDAETLFMSVSDYDYLLKNLDYRTVWLGMAVPKCYKEKLAELFRLRAK